MLLAIDIGNTQIAAGLFDRDELKTHWRLSSSLERTEDESWILMSSICAARGFDLKRSTGVAVSSVVPDMTPTFDKMARKYLDVEPVVVRHTLDLGLEIGYENPAEVGADRLCNAVAGYAKYGGPLIIVDFGTATTFDVISATGEYLGGIIAPGIEMSSAILHRRAARLPRVELDFPEHVIGRSTERSIQSGIMYGAVENVDGFVRRIREEMASQVESVATGGLAGLILSRLRTVDRQEAFLTLEGLRLIYRRVKK